MVMVLILLRVNRDRDLPWDVEGQESAIEHVHLMIHIAVPRQNEASFDGRLFDTTFFVRCGSPDGNLNVIPRGDREFRISDGVTW